MDKVKISLLNVVEYFGNAKRPIISGEEIVNAGWIYAIGVAPNPAQHQIIGLVVQTSAMTSSPHEVRLHNLHKFVKDWRCECTCKAGEGMKCKHIAACLIYLTRYIPIFNF